MVPFDYRMQFPISVVYTDLTCNLNCRRSTKLYIFHTLLLILRRNRLDHRTLYDSGRLSRARIQETDLSVTCLFPLFAALYDRRTSCSQHKLTTQCTHRPLMRGLSSQKRLKCILILEDGQGNRRHQTPPCCGVAPGELVGANTAVYVGLHARL